jgi:hypothetical protein
MLEGASVGFSFPGVLRVGLLLLSLFLLEGLQEAVPACMYQCCSLLTLLFFAGAIGL